MSTSERGVNDAVDVVHAAGDLPEGTPDSGEQRKVAFAGRAQPAERAMVGAGSGNCAATLSMPWGYRTQKNPGSDVATLRQRGRDPFHIRNLGHVPVDVQDRRTVGFQRSVDFGEPTADGPPVRPDLEPGVPGIGERFPVANYVSALLLRGVHDVTKSPRLRDLSNERRRPPCLVACLAAARPRTTGASPPGETVSNKPKERLGRRLNGLPTEFLLSRCRTSGEYHFFPDTMRLGLRGRLYS